MQVKINEFRELVKEKKSIDTNIALLQWELETIAPANGVEKISDIIGDLSLKSYHIITSDKFVGLLDFFKKNNTKLNHILKREVELLSEESERISKIPSNEYKDYNKLIAASQPLWEKAKNKADFGMLKDTLKKIFEYNRKFAKYEQTIPGKEKKSLYDILLEHYEKGMDTKKLDEFFSLLKKEIVPLLKKTLKNQDKHLVKLKKVDKENQLKFCKYVSKYLGFDFQSGVMGESEHPFTTTIDRQDVRFTTKFIEKEPLSSVFSTIHETGHGIYEQQIGNDLKDTLLETGGSMGLHESQSRFYENIIGRSKSFWKGIIKTDKVYPQLKKLKLNDIYKIANKVKRSKIRTESDELTYSLHIMVRYELEKGIINDTIKIDDLPKAWNNKMKEYLGVNIENDREGVLQDVHWACGLIGYFPSYAIGNAYSAQIYHSMKKDIDVNKLLEKGNLLPIKQWLGEKIHKYGLLKDTGDIIKNVTGKDLDPTYYINYLKNKFLTK